MADDNLCDARLSQLTVIDIQSRLAAVMGETERERVINRAGVLLQAAGTLGIPAIVTEQYPRGLGHTEEAVALHIADNNPVIDKTCFACGSDENYRDTLAAQGRRQLVLCGMESHICIMQTALSLTAEYQVFVVEDAVCSRNEANHRNAMARLRQAGIIVTNTESVLFEWLHDAGHEHFKKLSALIK